VGPTVASTPTGASSSGRCEAGMVTMSEGPSIQ
jgi:hypothetical protein